MHDDWCVCRATILCIFPHWRCDSEADLHQGSDEAGFL
ncbi:hypothetical protein FE810_07310 [Thalassotalea litorea]|uniref:Uncharacterized protein n=1 Tax=Thalassotalea litorea TaxID=2020715 RepID=A0A5R9IK06_9GAMM|nr:hypothetical protein FE810_07310 [Thalassotalea litorea]